MSTRWNRQPRWPPAGSTPTSPSSITLPNPTWEGRSCRAIRIHQGPDPARGGVYFLGGIHAREWGSPDILINFIRLLTDAYRTNTGITQGGMSITAADVRRIVTTLDVVVFPQANPDGRHHSMTVDPMWRKNRRPADPGAAACDVGGGDGPGVDINRNYDFLWDYPTKFSAAGPGDDLRRPVQRDLPRAERRIGTRDRQRPVAAGPSSRRSDSSSTSTHSARTSSTTGATTTTRPPTPP